ncbi:MAG: hypothetical protein ABJB11_06955 [Ferruginibacter sp.]
MASFFEKCDSVLFYLKEKSNGQRSDVIFPIKLDELERNTGVTFSDEVLNFLANDRKYIERHYSGSQYFNLTSAGMAFISHNSFVKGQKKIDEEDVLKWYHNANAKQQYDDYPKIKRQKDNAYIVAIVSAIISLSSVIIAYWQYTKC